MIIAGSIIGALVLLLLVFRLMWRVAEPNEALIISGLREHDTPDGAGESLGFKIVTGKGVLVLPGVQQVRRLSLDLREAELQIDGVTHQGIPLGIRGVVIFKVGDDYVSIANAARRFLDQQDQMEKRVHNVFAGHLRAIVGNMTVEEMIRDREKLTQLTRESSGMEMEKLGLIVDSLQVQEILDPTSYIDNLGRPHAAAVASLARIAQAGADREATQKEQEADALKAEAVRDSHIKQAGFQAEVDHASAQAKQAGPLTEATARQEVVVQETRVAELEAVRARGMAVAEAIKARADALAQNQDAVIGQQLAEQWPAIVEAAAKPFGGIDQLIVLNGAQGLSEVLAQALSQGVTGLRLARNLLAGEGSGNSGDGGNGDTKPAAGVAASDAPAGQ